jgi:hypothetical protein
LFGFFKELDVKTAGSEYIHYMHGGGQGLPGSPAIFVQERYRPHLKGPLALFWDSEVGEGVA